MRASLLCTAVLALSGAAAGAADICMPLVAKPITVDGLVVGAQIGGVGVPPASCPSAVPDAGWGGVLENPLPPVFPTIPGTTTASAFLVGQSSGGPNLDKIYVALHVENSADFSTGDKLCLYFQADSTKPDWDPARDFALTCDGIGPAGSPGGTAGCGTPGGQFRYYQRSPDNSSWVPLATLPAGVTFATSFDYESIADPESELWELEIGIDVSSLAIPKTASMGLGVKLVLAQSGIGTGMIFHAPSALTPVPDSFSPSDFLPNNGGVTPAKLQKVTVGNCTFDVVISSIKGTSNGGAVGQFTQLDPNSPSDFNQTTGQALKRNHFTADVKFVNPANLADSGAVAVANSGNVDFRIRPWNGGFTGNFLMKTSPRSFSAVGQSITIPTFDWPLTKADWLATGGTLNATSPGAHACYQVELNGFAVNLPGGDVMQQNLAYTSLSTVKESFLIAAPRESKFVRVDEKGGFDYILRARWNNLSPKHQSGPRPFRFKFTNADAIGLHHLKGDYYALRLKRGEKKQVELEISGGAMPHPGQQVKLSAKAGGKLLNPPTGEAPVEVKVKPGSLVSVVAQGLIRVDPDRAPSDPNGFTNRRLVEGRFLLSRKHYRPEERVGTLVASFDGFKSAFVVGTDATFAVPQDARTLSLAVNNVAGQYEKATGAFDVHVVVGDPVVFPTRLAARGSVANAELGLPAQMQPGVNLPMVVIDVGQRYRKFLVPTGYVAYAIYDSHPDRP